MQANENRSPASELGARAAESAVGQNVADFRVSDLLDSAKTLTKQAARHPGGLLRSYAGFLGEMTKVMVGASGLAPEPGDKRFAEAAWKDSKFYNLWLQTYLAASESMKQYAKSAGLDPMEAERATFLMSQISDALAPTNFLAGNPAALKRAIDTGGKSLLTGLQHLLDDVSKGRPVPSQVDERPFKVGENLAITPGSVVLRTEMFELLQYAPQTEKVRQRPILSVPSPVNKYYAADLAPGRSWFEHIVKSGLTLFTIVWRPPHPEHEWGLKDYLDSIDMAVKAVHNITGVEDPNLIAFCGAGPLVMSMAGYYAALRERRVNSLVLLVSMLDSSGLQQAKGIGGFMDPELSKRLKRLPKKKGGISAKEFTVIFSLLRSNDMIWNYWVNNYLMGNDPPAFDVLYWNADGSGMTGPFNKEFGELLDANKLLTPGAMQVRDTPIADIGTLDFDSYVVGAATDHICAWPQVYRSSQLLGERSQYVLANAGHIQTIVCPPGNAKSQYFVNSGKPATADEWLKGATKQQGTWWDHAAAWWAERSGPLVAAPRAAGNKRHKPLGKAPGIYVLERH